MEWVGERQQPTYLKRRRLSVRVMVQACYSGMLINDLRDLGCVLRRATAAQVRRRREEWKLTIV